MATTQVNLMQTAINGAATLVSAYVQAGIITSLDDAQAAFDAEREKIFGTFSGIEDAAPAAAAGPRATTGGAGQGGGRVFTAEEARATALNFGKFKGVTLGELENMTSAQVAEYGYGDGTDGKSGLGYLKYLANNDDPKAGFMKKNATAILEARRAQAS